MKKSIFLLLFFPAFCFSEIELRFSPRGGCDSLVLSLYGRAQRYIHVAMYSFTLQTMADSLISKFIQGVDVKVLMDNVQSKRLGSVADTLFYAGVPIKVNKHSGLMHMKMNVVDDSLLTLGSFNQTQSGVSSNDEVLALIRDSLTASTCENKFIAMWMDTLRFRNYVPGPTSVEKFMDTNQKINVVPELNIFPNPATRVANLRLQISDSRLKVPDYKSSNLSIFQSSVSIKIYDVQGRLVRQIPLTLKTDTDFMWDLRDEEGKKVSSGVYFVRLEIALPSSRNDRAEGKAQTKRILVIR